MKKLILLIILLATFLEAYVFTKTYKVVVHKDWKPYYFLNKDGKPSGYAIDLIEAISRESNVKIEYIIVDNWSQGQNLIKIGKADIIPNIGISQKRSSLFLFTQPTDTFSINLFKRKNSTVNSKDDINNSIIGLVDGNICSKFIKEQTTSRFKQFNKFRVALNNLLAGDIDVLCYPKPILDYKLKELNIKDKIESFAIPLIEVKRGVGISHKSFELLTVFEEVITELKITGEYQEIHAKWFNVEKKLEFSKNDILLISLFAIFIIVILLFTIFYLSKKKKWLLTKEDLEKEVQEKTEKLIKLSTTDSLTQIYNREKLNEILNREIKVAKRTKEPFLITMIDIDFFKEVNDDYGHLIGDEVLIEFTNIINRNIRDIDYFGRWGGEEFILISSYSDKTDFLIFINRIKETIERHIFPKGIQKTASFGVTTYTENDDITSITQRVDQALYQAKESGRNKVVYLD